MWAVSWSTVPSNENAVVTALLGAQPRCVPDVPDKVPTEVYAGMEAAGYGGLATQPGMVLTSKAGMTHWMMDIDSSLESKDCSDVSSRSQSSSLSFSLHSP